MPGNADTVRAQLDAWTEAGVLLSWTEKHWDGSLHVAWRINPDHSDGSGSDEGVGVDRPVAPLSSYQAAPSSDDHSDGSTVSCDECGKPIDIVGPDLSENGHICEACAVRISLGVPLIDGTNDGR